MADEQKIIYHVCTAASWEVQLDNKHYVHASLADEGFIHCSTKDQVGGVLERYFKGQKDLFVLTLETNKLESKLVYELATIGEYFPHIYGPINRSAISEITEINNL